MRCSLENTLKSEHEKIKDRRYAEQYVNCPLFNSKQICYWCCLHISEQGDPFTRARASDNFPAYAEKIPELAMNRGWDDIWQVCSKCASR